mmetsp:Transcript_22053/g.41544  ORF Transcript_22053/g.41544 Transcript_22053/m.41544 type:complete len:155 (+) Transcript_22053:76-540(+)
MQLTGPVPAGRVVMRCIDDLEFEVAVLQVQGNTADVCYLDDGNIEQGVPMDELDWKDSDRKLSPDQQRILEEGFAKLAEATPSCPASSPMRWEQGRFQEEDGAVVLSSCISVLTPEAVKDSDVAVQACGNGLRGIRSLRRNRSEAEAPAAPAAA